MVSRVPRGANLYSDGVYSRKPWNTPEEAAYPPQGYIGPFQSNQDRLLNQALAVHTMSGPEIQELVRPPLPQVNLFPPKYGYEESELVIEDIIDLPRSRPTAQRVESDFSNMPNSPQGTSRNTLGYGV